MNKGIKRRARRLPQQVATALKRAGVTVGQLDGLTREAVLSLPRVGPWAVRQIERFRGRSFESVAPYWIARGLPATVAGALAAAGIRTEETLRRMRREDFLDIRGIGPHAARLLLDLLGSPSTAGKPTTLTFLERVPQARIWVEAGIIAPCAANLVRAGIPSIEILAGQSREDLLAIRGIGETTLRVCEQLLGRPLHSVSAYWRERGMPVVLANALGRAGVKSIEAMEKMSREDLLGISGIGEMGLRRCEELVGRPLHSYVEQWQSVGLTRFTAWRLVRAGIVSINSLRARLESLWRLLDDAEIHACKRIVSRFTGGKVQRGER